MSSTTVKLGDDSIRVPRLTSQNWVVYKTRIDWAADAKGYAGHLDGTSVEPSPPVAPKATTTTAANGTTTTAPINPDIQAAYNTALVTY